MLACKTGNVELTLMLPANYLPNFEFKQISTYYQLFRNSQSSVMICASFKIY